MSTWSPADRQGGQRDRTFAPGEVLAGRYRVEQFVARGGMGEVYQVLDLQLGVGVALKTLRPQIAPDPAALRRFKQELFLARSVSHPNICRVFSFGRHRVGDQERFFLTMEFLPGETLSARIHARGRLGAEETLSVLRQLAPALDAAHRAGVVHRDFKSANVLLVPSPEGERVVITDFGLALGAGSGGREANWALATASMARSSTAVQGRIVGTPHYMSPEQVRAEPVGPPSDLYALGIVLFEMVTGSLPFRGATPRDVAMARLSQEPIRPSALAAVSEELEAAISRLLAHEPEERPACAMDAVLVAEGRPVSGFRARHSLPGDRDEFVGREAELRELCARLEPGPALITIVGSGGMGKTRLARDYAWNTLSRWPGGVWFCDLTDARDLDGILLAVGTGLDVPLGRQDPVVQLGHAIAGRGRALVVLDNFDRVADHAGATLGRWLERAAAASFLVTSQMPLGLAAEVCLPLGPLSSGSEGIELFHRRARYQRADFESTQDPAAVAQIVDSCDGVPLAIELVAARLRNLTVTELRQRLTDHLVPASLGFLGNDRGPSDALARMLEWTWGLLEPWEQEAAAQASVFEGGFTLEAAEAVLEPTPSSGQPEVVDVVQALVDSSWLLVRFALGSPRFQMPTSLGEYAARHLSEAPPTRQRSEGVDLGRFEVRHGQYFSRFGEEDSYQALNRHGGSALRQALSMETSNLLTACRRAIARIDGELALAVLRAATDRLLYGGPFAPVIELTGEILAIPNMPTSARALTMGFRATALRVAGRADEAQAQFEEALKVGAERAERGDFAAVLTNYCGFRLELGRIEDLGQHLERVLAIHRQTGNRQGEAVTLQYLGILAHLKGSFPEARRHYAAALSLAREVGDPRVEGAVQSNLGAVCIAQGRVEAGRQALEAGLEACRESGDRRNAGNILGHLGALETSRGRFEPAKRMFEAALAIHCDVGDRRSEGSTLNGLGVISAALGRLQEAREYYERGLAIQREIGSRRFEGVMVGNLGIVLHEGGEVGRAALLYEQALAIHREVGNRGGEGNALENLGRLRHQEGRLDDARRCFEQALTIQRGLVDSRGVGITLGALAALDLDEMRYDDSRRCLCEGEAMLRQVDDCWELGKLLCVRGECEIRTGDRVAARSTLEQIDAIALDLKAGSTSELGRRLGSLRRSLEYPLVRNRG